MADERMLQISSVISEYAATISRRLGWNGIDPK
jgi:hypothetical protein